MSKSRIAILSINRKILAIHLFSHCLLLLKWTSWLSNFPAIVVQADNPSSIIQPYDGPDPGYILAESNGGFANRLRVLASYMYVGDFKFGGAHLVFIWDTNPACPGHFLSVFEPIDKVIFATNSSRYVLDKKAKIVYENSYAVMHWILIQNEIPKNRHGFPSWREIEYNMYSKFFPVKEILQKVKAFVVQHGICNSSAMHLRTTDLDQVLGERKRLNLKAFVRFVEGRPHGEKVFVLTDHPDVQRFFLDKFGAQKVIFYALIPVEQQKDRALPSLSTPFQQNSSSTPPLPPEHRFTSLEHTLIDVLIAAHAKVFKPSPFSSLSELVKMFEHIGKKDRGWCKGSS